MASTTITKLPFAFPEGPLRSSAFPLLVSGAAPKCRMVNKKFTVIAAGAPAGTATYRETRKVAAQQFLNLNRLENKGNGEACDHPPGRKWRVCDAPFRRAHRHRHAADRRRPDRRHPLLRPQDGREYRQLPDGADRQ